MAFHLDHIIILLPYADLLSLPEWITSNFTITPGGVHKDGKTENRLIVFLDGSYIELISFVNDDPKNREGHWWGDKNSGIIDFALTNRSNDAKLSYSQLQERLSKLDIGDGAPKVEYQPPIAGGRVRPDGKEVKWNVTFPVVTTGYQRGGLPFFCHDTTPRELRAPFDETFVTHPNGAHGIDEFNIYVTEDRLDAVSKAFSAILGVPNSEKGNAGGTLVTEKLKEVDGAKGTVFKIRLPSEEQKGALEERGGLLLGGLVLGSVDGKASARIDIENGGIGGVFGPVK